MGRIPRFLGGSLLALAGAGGALPARAQDAQPIPGVQEIAADTLTDVAIAAVDLPEPAIYYNPQLMQRYGPLVGQFFLIHEYGHIAFHHSRRGLPESGRDSVLRQQELEADCYAATWLGARHRAAAEAAVRFFARLGPFSFDAVHPTGAQRVARILSCLPTGRPKEVGQWIGENGIESGPVGGPPDRVTFTIRTPGLGGGYGRDVGLWVDGLRVGQISNLRSPATVAVNRFSAGLHNYRLRLDLYGMDDLMQFRPSGTVMGVGQFAVKDGDAFTVSWSLGSAPELVKETRERE